MPNSPDGPLGLVVGVLRTTAGLSQKQLARLSGLPTGSLSKLERGKRSLSRERCEELALAMGLPRSAVDDALAFVAQVQSGARSTRPPRQGAATDEVERSIDACVAMMEKAAGELSRVWLERLVLQGRALEARRRAPGLRARLFAHPPEARLALVREVAEFQDWALAALLCDGSAAAAPDSADDALALAELALAVARLVPGDSGWRSRVEGYACAHVANARRVGGDLRAADEAFARALSLWEAGAASDPGLLDLVRLLDLEASLRKDQRRLDQALELIGRALAARPAAEVEGRLLIKRACTLEKLERYEEALAALEAAAPLVETARDARLRFGWRFDRLVNLCHLGRHAEAQAGLRQVRELALQRAKALDLVRVTWLEGRIAAGLGRPGEALAAFERVREELTAKGIAYDTALVTLDLASVLAELGRPAEVKRLAQQSAWIFEAQGVHKEALRALDAFRRAARSERLTVDLARTISRFLNRARHDPELRFREEAA